jgi:hypothetical protein
MKNNFAEKSQETHDSFHKIDLAQHKTVNDIIIIIIIVQRLCTQMRHIMQVTH